MTTDNNDEPCDYCKGKGEVEAMVVKHPTAKPGRFDWWSLPREKVPCPICRGTKKKPK